MGRWNGNPTADLAVIKVTQGKRYVQYQRTDLTWFDGSGLLLQLPIQDGQHCLRPQLRLHDRQSLNDGHRGRRSEHRTVECR